MLAGLFEATLSETNGWWDTQLSRILHWTISWTVHCVLLVYKLPVIVSKVLYLYSLPVQSVCPNTKKFTLFVLCTLLNRLLFLFSAPCFPFISFLFCCVIPSLFMKKKLLFSDFINHSQLLQTFGWVGWRSILCTTVDAHHSRSFFASSSSASILPFTKFQKA